VDYIKLKGSVIIPTGKSFVDINVFPIRDALAEGRETVVIKLKPRFGYQIGEENDAVITIADAPKKRPAVRPAARLAQWSDLNNDDFLSSDEAMLV
jgi:hypothetical protein